MKRYEGPRSVKWYEVRGIKLVLSVYQAHSRSALAMRFITVHIGFIMKVVIIATLHNELILHSMKRYEGPRSMKWYYVSGIKLVLSVYQAHSRNVLAMRFITVHIGFIMKVVIIATLHNERRYEGRCFIMRHYLVHYVSFLLHSRFISTVLTSLCVNLT